jgi:predicted RNase H-like nuclease (RuvC/YqgF family)
VFRGSDVSRDGPVGLHGHEKRLRPEGREANLLAKSASDLERRNKELQSENEDLKKQVAAKDDIAAAQVRGDREGRMPSRPRWSKRSAG